ncbi:hypothetical protein HIM_10019 [Hirsutella minnesotensis 3608]|uniref:Uncharacterized protein n=1 Tax=Hirsutella minnesotensis 3608 TaxID=1043627 RepID=A0A0F7ZKI9_9HYPO|nr:hypothetical protein HIM_10019 [Hirsutella minnesotensis 3608]
MAGTGAKFPRSRTEMRHLCRQMLASNISKKLDQTRFGAPITWGPINAYTEIETELGLVVSPRRVTLMPSATAMYAWQVEPHLAHLFTKQISRHGLGACQEICSNLGGAIKAIYSPAPPRPLPLLRPTAGTDETPRCEFDIAAAVAAETVDLRNELQTLQDHCRGLGHAMAVAKQTCCILQERVRQVEAKNQFQDMCMDQLEGTLNTVVRTIELLRQTDTEYKSLQYYTGEQNLAVNQHIQAKSVMPSNAAEY